MNRRLDTSPGLSVASTGGVLFLIALVACSRLVDSSAASTGSADESATSTADFDQEPPGGPVSGAVFLTKLAGRNDIYSVSPVYLSEWQKQYLPPSEPLVRSAYRNTRELGFWRKLTCTKTFHRGGPGACMVSNYNQFDDLRFGLATAGTVTMNISATGYIEFGVFNYNDDGTTPQTAEEQVAQIFVRLDSGGLKPTPAICKTCHNGTLSDVKSSASTDPGGSVFREFEPSLLQARPGITQAQAEQEWYDLNQVILAANDLLASQPKVNHARAAVRAHVEALYAGLGEPRSHPNAPFSRSLDDTTLMPSSWRDADSASQALWSSVVNPYCMECHRINAFDFSSFAAFSSLRSTSSTGSSRLRQYLADAGHQPGVAYMPQAELAYHLLRTDHTAQAAIDAWTGEGNQK